MQTCSLNHGSCFIYPDQQTACLSQFPEHTRRCAWLGSTGNAYTGGRGQLTNQPSQVDDWHRDICCGAPALPLLLMCSPRLPTERHVRRVFSTGGVAAYGTVRCSLVPAARCSRSWARASHDDVRVPFVSPSRDPYCNLESEDQPNITALIAFCGRWGSGAPFEAQLTWPHRI
jgi:hypothetical protein